MPPSPAPSDGYILLPMAANPSADASHAPDGMASRKDTICRATPHPRFASPTHEDDFLAQEASQLYHQRPYDPSLTGYPSRDRANVAYGPLPGEPGYDVRNNSISREPDILTGPQVHAPYTPEASPPTPNGADSIAIRSGINVSKTPRQARSSSRVKGGRVQKSTKDSKQRKATSILTKPLSELAREVPHVPVADIATFVARTAEERRLETSRNKKSGQVKRPMNAFMLYRKAYQEVAKTQCTQKNHQLVSKVCGAGWPMEPDQVQQLFNKWAKIERDNHQKAHPGYKFTPSKTRKVKQNGESGAESPARSEIDDPTWASPQPPRHTLQRGSTRHASRMSETPSLNHDPLPEGNIQPMAPFQDMYQFATPNRPHPAAYGGIEASPYAYLVHQIPNLRGMQHPMSRQSSPGRIYLGRQPVRLEAEYPDSYYPDPDSIYNSSFEECQSTFDRAHFNMSRDGVFAHPEAVWPANFADGQDLGLDNPTTYAEDEFACIAYLQGNKADWSIKDLPEDTTNLQEEAMIQEFIQSTEQGY